MLLDDFEFELRLNNPITPEQWDLLTDVDFDHTDRIWFHTKHDKDVTFVKERKGKWKTAYLDHEAMGERPRIYYCSVCCQCIAYPTNYCPNCGADMRGDTNGET